MSTFQQFNVYEGLTSCRVVATANQSGTYLNGIVNNGVGATFTYGTGVLTIDGVTLNAGDRVLFTAQSSAFQNGIYIVNQAGAVGVAAILQRSADFQNVEQMKAGQYVSVSEGTVSAGSMWVLNSPLPAHLGVNNIVFSSGQAAGLGTAASKAASNNSLSTLASVSGATVTGNLVSAADVNGTIQDSGVVANKVLISSFASPDVNANIIRVISNNISAANLNAGTVAAFTPAGSSTYNILAIRCGGSGNSNFSGGGGDRNIGVSVGATAYGAIPAATAQALASVPLLLGGGTTFAYSSGAAVTQAVSSANPINIANSGGTTNYTAGNIVLEFLLIRTS